LQIRAFIQQPDRKRIVTVLLILAGFAVFAIFIHRQGIYKAISIAGLFFAAYNMHIAARNGSIAAITGITLAQKKILLHTVVGILAGMLLGFIARYVFELDLFPDKLTASALVAPVIGILEELVFRGFLQGYLRATGRIFSIVFAASGHTLYKFLVIFSLAGPLEFNFPNLIIATFIVGILAGWLRDASKSVIPPALGHACFDILLYGGFITLPVWVWG